MNTGKIFVSGRSQAVRLPKECRFRVREVMVHRVNDMVILFPRKKGWDILADGIEHFTADFLSDRNQPTESDKRKPL